MTRRIVRFNGFEVDFARRELRSNGQRIAIQQKPFQVLELLLQNPGELVSRQQLIRYLWPDSHVAFAHGLNTAVNSLRLALNDSDPASPLVETRPRYGYCFAAPVEEHATSLSAEVSSHDVQQSCIRGRHLLDRLCAEETHKALAFFRAALALQPACASAYAGIAESYCQLAQLTRLSPAYLSVQAKAAAAAATDADPQLPEAHLAAAHTAYAFDWNWPLAERSVQHSLSIHPGCSPAHSMYAAVLLASGRPESALDAAQTAFRLDPLSYRANLQLARSLCATGHFEETVAQCWQFLSLAPRSGAIQIQLAIANEQLDRPEEALDEFRNARLYPETEWAASFGLAHALFRQGSLAESASLLAALSAEADDRRLAYGQALLATAAGDGGAAVHHLHRALDARDPSLLHLAADPRLQPLCDDPQFHRFLARLDGYSARSASVGSMRLARRAGR